MHHKDESPVPSGRRQLAPAIAYGALGTLATIAQMALLSDIAGRVLIGHQQLAQVLPSAGLLLGAMTVRAVLVWREEVSAQRAALHLTSSLRQRLIAHLLQLGPAYLQHERSGELATTATEGVERLTPYYQRYLPLRTLSVVVPALVVLAVLKVDLLGAAVLLATAPVIPLLMALIGRYSQAEVQRNWLALARMGAQFLDTLQGLPTLLLFGRGDAAGERVRAASEAFAAGTLRVLRVAFLSGMVLDIMIGMAIGLVAVVVAIQLLDGRLPFSSALLVLLLTPECYRPLRELGAQRHAAMEGKAAGERLTAILNAPVPTQMPRLSSAEADVHCSEPGGSAAIAAPLTVRFSGVTYCYRGKNGGDRDGCPAPALAGLSLTLLPGTATALVGRSGAGKSTLISLLLRFLDPDEGTITANGVGLRDLPPARWREQLALVPQHPHLFVGTVADNLRLARPAAGQAELEWAAEQAGAAEFIARLPGGYTAAVGEQGAMLSTGQVQRLAIARAFLKDAPLLILDEPTSALDPESELHVRRSLERLVAGRTVLIVAHRRSTIMAADQIAVLDHGHLLEIGSQRELMERGGAYARLMGGVASGPSRLALPTSKTWPKAPNLGERNAGGRAEASLERCSPLAMVGMGHQPRDFGSPPRLGESCRRQRGGLFRPRSQREVPPAADSLRGSPTRDLPPTPPRLLPRLLAPLRPHLGLVALSLLLGLLTGLAGIGLLATGGYLVGAAALGTPILALGIPIALVRVFGVGRGIVRYAERLSAHRITFTLVTDLRVWCYRRLLPLAPASLGAFRSGDLLTRLIKDVADIQRMYLNVWTPVLLAAALSVLIIAFFAHFSLLLAGVMFGFLSLAGIGMPWLVYHLSRAAQERIVAGRAALQAQLVDLVQGMADLLTLGRQTVDPGGLNSVDGSLHRSNYCLVRIAGLQRMIVSLLAAGALWTVLVLSVRLIDQGVLKAVDLPVLVLVALVSFEAVQPLGAAFGAFRSTTAAAARVYDLLDAAPAIADPPRPLPAPTAFDIWFEHITFAYQPGGPPTLSDVSFRVPQGGRVAIVGPSGSGKTTLANLLVRFWDPDGGTIRLGGQDLRRYALDALRRTIGVVSQRTTIFSGTLRHNLLLARPEASDAALLRTLKQAKLDELPARSPLDLQRWVGEQGAQLSGGERQRLAIARTLLSDAPVLVLDEPTANLDPLTERELLIELADIMAGRTTIYITHRLVGLEDMDEIIVLDGGRIVERGTHAQLVARQGPYRRMLDAQDQFVDQAEAGGGG